ncbi:hypothetical protein [Haladaptatus sp. NG-WS-4]
MTTSIEPTTTSAGPTVRPGTPPATSDPAPTATTTIGETTTVKRDTRPRPTIVIDGTGNATVESLDAPF